MYGCNIATGFFVYVAYQERPVLRSDFMIAVSSSATLKNAQRDTVTMKNANVITVAFFMNFDDLVYAVKTQKVRTRGDFVGPIADELGEFVVSYWNSLNTALEQTYPR